MREKYEAELKEERAAVEKLLDQRKQQVEMEMELNRLRLVLRQKDHDIEDLVQVRVRHHVCGSSKRDAVGNAVCEPLCRPESGWRRNDPTWPS